MGSWCLFPSSPRSAAILAACGLEARTPREGAPLPSPLWRPVLSLSRPVLSVAPAKSKEGGVGFRMRARYLERAGGR